MAARFDFEREGLLDGLSGARRRGRERLLEELTEAGYALDELREAVAEGRLTLLPLERALSGAERFTPTEVAERAGVDRETLEEQWRALGMAAADPDEPSQTADEIAAAERVRAFLDAGFDADALRETSRVMAMAMSQVAAANRELVGGLFADDAEEGGPALDEEPEDEVAHRLEALVSALVPMVGPTLEHIYKLHLREQLRSATIAAAGSPGGEEMAIAFVDLVGFTRLGEELPPEQFGEITSRFGELATEAAADGSVRLVKLIGDAAMFASPQPQPLLGAALDLVGFVEREGEGFPGARAGVGYGQVVSRSGDLYGRAANLASRLSSAARPGTVLVSESVRERLAGERGAGEFRFSDAGGKRLKGIGGSVRVFRARRR